MSDLMADPIRAALDGPAHPPPPDASIESEYQRIFRRNREWVASLTRGDPEFFARRATEQRPTFLFIGCSDSRVPAELLTGAQPGEMFVHRNIANLAPHADVNLLSVLHYAVDVLRVKAIVVCGHYGCGGVRAAMSPEPHGFVDHWLGNVRDVMRLHEAELAPLAPGPNGPRERRLVELNAAEQARRIRRSPVVQAAWARGQALSIHAMVYDLADGILHDLGGSEGHDLARDAQDAGWLREVGERAAADAVRREAGPPIAETGPSAGPALRPAPQPDAPRAGAAW
jgi:carbonic anhydrase